MSFHWMITALAPSAARSMRHWFVHLGGIGLIPLGLLDSSLIPVPGSLDLLTIILAARDQDLWPYYAFMATVGSVVGAFFTYRLARRGKNAAVAHKMSSEKFGRISGIFERWGFAAVVIPSLLPPPMPMVPFVFAAGAAQYSLKKFLAAMGLGRAVRYTLLAFLGAHYGRHILRLISQHTAPVLLGAFAFIALATAAFFFIRALKSRHAAPHHPSL